ncbi:MAG: TonB-dependent receptor plug domain-containing protein [Janthinobacterium lividum]
MVMRIGATSAAYSLVATSLAFAQTPAAEPGDIQLPAITVQGARTESNPLYSQAQEADLGPLGRQKLQDTPYTVNVVPQSLIDNQQLKSVQDTLRYIPSVQGTAPVHRAVACRGRSSKIPGWTV